MQQCLPFVSVLRLNMELLLFFFKVFVSFLIGLYINISDL